MSDEKPREFWIDRDCLGNDCYEDVCHVQSKETKYTIHVIEKSAYDELAERHGIVSQSNKLKQGTIHELQRQREQLKEQLAVATKERDALAEDCRGYRDFVRMARIKHEALVKNIAENSQLKSEVFAALQSKLTTAVEALEHGRAAMIYAHEDHSDQYYLNVKEQIEMALAKISSGAVDEGGK